MQNNQDFKNAQNNENVVETKAVKVDVSLDDTVKTNKKYYALYLSNIVGVPGVNLTCDVQNEREAYSIKRAFDAGTPIVLVASKKTDGSDVQIEDFYDIGCLAFIKKVSNQADTLKVMVTGERRVKITKFENATSLTVEVDEVAELNTDSAYTLSLVNDIKSTLAKLANERILPVSLRSSLFNVELTPSEFADSLVHLLAKNDVAQQGELLNELDVEKRLEMLLGMAKKFIQELEIRKEIDDKVNSNIQKTQKEIYLREQLNVISKELNGEADENEEFRKKVKELGMPKDSEEKVLKEINRMSKLPFGSPELGYIRNFIETVIELPWSKRTKDNIDIEKARQILNNEHYALDEVKERILETLAVIKLTKKVNAQIICLVGPPGVGKTSIAKSIANAMGREYVQVSLGGVNDESVIRGHRRTYVGAMSGRILAGMKQAGTINPVFLLDEIDKMTADARGDPASALLEVLDPAQNDHFKDSFLELPYDLSQVMFILTANDESKIPYALHDRMEIIHLRAYTEFEKIEIAKKYLLPKQEKLAGIPEGTVNLSDDLLRVIINEYTFEGGVRELERKIATICRKYATFIVEGKKFKDVALDNIEDYLGKDRYPMLDIYRAGKVGEIVGLSVYGDIVGKVLLIESVLVPGKAEIVLTGKPGKAMKESAEQVYTLVRSRAKDWGISKKVLKNNTIHVHIPQTNGVEGPSAGTAMTTAVVSALTGIPTKANVAMTGEISIRGKVLPIGGVRDKLIAADRAGIKLCIIPKDNEKDLYNVPQEVKDRMEIKTVSTIDEVLALALQTMPASKNDDDDDDDDDEKDED